jgi:5'-3' exonuclease
MKTFKELSETDSSVLMVVDALNLAFRYKHSKAKSFVDQYISTVESLKRSYKADKVIITCDDGSSSYRRNIFPEYKANRVEKYKDQTPSEQREFEEFLEEFARLIDTYKEIDDYPVLKFKNVEADDLAAYIVNKYKKTSNIWLMSSDKDWDLLVCDTVSRFSYVTRKEITLNNWSEHYDYSPDDHISIKCLTGDSGDNIPGVRDVGTKRATQLLQEYGSTYDIIANLPIISRYKYISNLNRFGGENLIRNYKLMDLVTYCEEAIGNENCKEINNILEKYLGTK